MSSREWPFLSLYCSMEALLSIPHLPHSGRAEAWAYRSSLGMVPPVFCFGRSTQLSCDPWFTLWTLAICLALSCPEVGTEFFPSICLAPTYTSACLVHARGQLRHQCPKMPTGQVTVVPDVPLCPAHHFLLSLVGGGCRG